MMPMNNPLAMIAGAVRSGQNPTALLQQMAGRDPQIRQVMGMISGKSGRELEQMARNMARERGVNIDDVARSLGIQIPSQR